MQFVSNKKSISMSSTENFTQHGIETDQLLHSVDPDQMIGQPILFWTDSPILYIARVQFHF